MPRTDTPSNASLPRRLAAMFYDSLLLLAVWMAATAIWLVAHDGQTPQGHQLLFRLYLVGVAVVFFTGFWVRAGRTLGMQAWRLRVVNTNGELLDWATAGLRFLAACLSLVLLGGGFFWALFDRRGLTLHDRLTATRVILVPRRS